MKRLAMIATLLVGAMFTTAVFAQNDMAATPETVVDIAVDNENFSTLVEALQTAGLVEALQGDGPFTVFAPTNAAFVDLAEERGLTVEQLLRRADLTDILEYHVVPTAVTSTELLARIEEDAQNEAELETLEDSDLRITSRLVFKLFVDGSAEVIAEDFEAGNGYVHVVDEVLLP